MREEKCQNLFEQKISIVADLELLSIIDIKDIANSLNNDKSLSVNKLIKLKEKRGKGACYCGCEEVIRKNGE